MIYLELKSRLSVEYDQTVQTIISGACSDYATYRQLTGYLKGLNDAIKIVEVMTIGPDD